VKKVLFHPLPLDRLKALGNLLPLLYGDFTEAQIQLMVRKRLSQDEADWSIALLELFKHNHLVEQASSDSNFFEKMTVYPRVTFMGHSSLLMQSGQSAVLVDPVLRPDFRLSRHAFDVLRIQLGAICCSHSHWDHCDLQTLLWFNKDIPIIIPKIQRPTAFNPPIVEALKMLGFTDIREAQLWEPIQIDDIELIPVPFHGEQDEPDADINHYTYVLRTKEITLYGGVDCFRDTYGEMKPVLEKVRETYKPNVAFLPISRMIYHYEYGGVNGFCRYLDTILLNQTFQYTASAQDAAEWMGVLGVNRVVPYATFTFSRFPMAPEIREFARMLRKAGLSKCLYPLRPLDTLKGADLNGHLWSKMSRQILVNWSLFGGLVSYSERRLKSYRVYKLFRSVLCRLILPLRSRILYWARD
jgi:L-ascorbate metabolism protein UlaG (beta-lactamase superfamily)